MSQMDRTVTLNLYSATNALRDIATLIEHGALDPATTTEYLRSLADRYETIADTSNQE